MILQRATILLCSCFTFAVVIAQSSDDQTIRELRLKSNSAIARHDTASIASFWLDDVYVLTSRSTALNGKQVNQLAFQQDFESKENLLYVRTPNTIEVFSNWNMASEYGRWTGTWVSNKISIRISGSYYAKWHKVEGVWKIKSETYTPTHCEGGEYCKPLNPSK